MTAETPPTGGGWADLTAFQRDLIVAIVSLNASDQTCYGLGIKRWLEDWYGEDVNHGRLYPNLTTLVERGLVEKHPLDQRTNRYALTDTGESTLANYGDLLASVTETTG